MTDLNGISVVPEPSAERLNDRQRLDYRSHREDCLGWLLALGKTPKKAEGYAVETVKARSHRMDAFYRWVWDQEGYTINVTHSHADRWLRHLARQETSNVHKSNCRKAVQMLFKWYHHERGMAEWDPQISFSTNESAAAPKDYLTLEERSKIREAALEYGSIPNRDSLSPEQRGRWRAHLAQRFQKPKGAITDEDWDRANGWKIPSLVWVSLDGGLRPIEVARARTSWVDIENGVLRIPKGESSKSTENWIVGLQDRTVDVLDRWLEQRRTYPMYDETDTVWLTREGNPYQSSSLRDVIGRLCEIADIPTEDRQMSWYAIRHSTGTYMTREEDLAAAQAQLRHKSAETTMKYDQVPVEDRRDALNRMG